MGKDSSVTADNSNSSENGETKLLVEYL